MIGKRIGMLTVARMLEKSKVECICDCGASRVMRVGHFNSGGSKSCGCHWRFPSGYDRESAAYGNMMARCHNPSNKRYKDYGMAGIHVCEEWRKSKKQFIADMGKCPEGFQIDRIDNRKGYSKENCRWVSPRDNMINRSISAIYVIDGVEFVSSSDAAKKLGISTATVFAWCKGRVAKGIYYPPKSGCFFKNIY